jgi:S1-C subfamily serine protease
MRVVIAPESEVSDAVRECLVSWSRVGLLGPFCLWLVPLGGDPAAVPDSVERIKAGEARPGSLGEALQGTPSDQVHLIGFYASGPLQGFDTGFAPRVEHCIAIANEVLAYEKGHPIESTVIVVPERIGQRVPLEVFCGTWNLYVAPEDRAAPPEANQLPNSDGLLPRHAAHALATIADLWSNASVQPTGALAAVAGREAFAIDPPAVRVVRCFSRVIDLGYVPDHVAAGVFKAGGAWPNPDPNRFDRASDPTRVIAAATRELVAIHGEIIGLTQFQPLELPPEKRPPLWEALRELIRLIEARIRRLPSDLADATLGKAHDHLAGMIDRYRGPEAAKTLRWRERPAEERKLVDLTAELGRPLYTPDGPTAAVWGDLRQLALGLIDGAPLPERMDPEAYVQAGKRMLVTSPEAIGPDPEVPLPVADVGRACDPLNLDPRFAPEEETTESEDDELAAEREARQRILEEWSARLRPTLLWSVGTEIATALEVAREAAAELEAEAVAAFEDAGGGDEGEEEDGEPTVRDESDAAKQKARGSASKARWRGLRNRLLIYTSFAVLASALAWSKLDLLPAVGAQLAVLAAWTAALLNTALGFVVKERAIIRGEVVAQLEIVNRATHRALRAGDQPRLERRYGEFLDWAEVIGWMAHHPWVGEPIGRVEVQAPVRQSTLPSAFRVGAGLVSAEILERLCGQARASVFDTGWLTDQYRVSLEDLQRRLGLSRSYSGEEGSVDPDADVLEDPDSPRRQLRDAIRRGDGRHLKDNEMTEGVLRFIDQLPLDGTAAGVATTLALRSSAEADGDQLEALPPCPAWFAPPAHLGELTPQILAAVVRINASTPIGPQVGLGAMVGPANAVVTSLRVVVNASAIRVQLADGTQCEASLTRALPGHDLALLQLAEVPEGFEVSSLELADREPQLGDPVLAPSPPDRETDQPEVALGLLVKAGRRSENGAGGLGSVAFGATYRTVAGPAGSPVFDLGGGLIGIHRSAPLSTEDGARTSVVRAVAGAAQVRALLEAEEAEPASIVDGNGELPASAPDLGTEVPSRFLGALFEADPGQMGMLPKHWVDSDGEHMPELTLGLDGFDYAALHAVAAPVEFLQPVRVIVHRVDVSSAVAARELRSCAGGDQTV